MRDCTPERLFFFELYQEPLGVVRDCKLFSRENRWPDFLNIIISADRPATSAKSAIFDKNAKKMKKTTKIEVFIKWPEMAETFHKNFW